MAASSANRRFSEMARLGARFDMRLVRAMVALVGLAGLVACTGPGEIARVEDSLSAPSPIVGTPFTRALTQEYRDLARHEALKENDWGHAALFADKAEQAAIGEAVPPEDPATTPWTPPAEALPALRSAHESLIGALESGARVFHPVETAQAQASFDCWVEEAWEGEADAACRDRFHALRSVLYPPPPPPATAALPEPAPSPPPAESTPQPIVIGFGFDRADITASAMQTLWNAAPGLIAARPTVIRIEGFTDSVGKSTYNRALSERRARAVARQLKTLGVTAPVIEIIGQGVGHASGATGRNPDNRRVAITWEASKSASSDEVSTLIDGKNGEFASTSTKVDAPETNASAKSDGSEAVTSTGGGHCRSGAYYSQERPQHRRPAHLIRSLSSPIP
jgi:OOP family OmpA-OmpF porin